MNGGKGTPQTVEGHVAMQNTTSWLTNIANGVLATQHTDFNRVCSVSNVIPLHATHVFLMLFTPLTKVRPSLCQFLKQPTNGQEQHCVQVNCTFPLSPTDSGEMLWSKQTQHPACPSYIHYAFHMTVLENNKSALEILHRSPSTSKWTKKKKKSRKYGKIHLQSHF